MGSATDHIIVAPATLTGGAIAIVRLSGEGSIELCDKLFRGVSGRPLSSASTHTLHYGDFCNVGGETIDDVLVSIFRAPHSYTGEESVEISCHGSQYIVQEIISQLIVLGATAAEAGEFTTRAYLAGRIDLSQAEAVADMIASSSRAQHAMASTQMRGGYSSRLADLRSQLVEVAALLELELDFSEEEVEFADRSHLADLMSSLESSISSLAESFAVGNAIKNGVQVAIVGEPNVGKSTLLNRLLGDERAMVSDIAGTTRDLVEGELIIDGITYRFVDTAGVHTTDDRLEQMGIERTLEAIKRAHIIIHLLDAGASDEASFALDESSLGENQHLIRVVNKVDLIETEVEAEAEVEVEVEAEAEAEVEAEVHDSTIFISAKSGLGLSELTTKLSSLIDTSALFSGTPIVSNSRHYALLHHSLTALRAAQEGLTTGLATDLLCQEIREILHNIGSITGTITTDDLLGEIFSKFCVGK